MRLLAVLRAGDDEIRCDGAAVRRARDPQIGNRPYVRLPELVDPAAGAIFAPPVLEEPDFVFPPRLYFSSNERISVRGVGCSHTEACSGGPITEQFISIKFVSAGSIIA